MDQKKEKMMVDAIRKGAKIGGIPKNEHVDRFYKPPRRFPNSESDQYQSVKKEPA